MKISEAMALGSLLLEPLAGVYLNQDQTSGCAWGMVHKAVGPAQRDEMLQCSRNIRVSLPCACIHDRMAIGGGMCLVPTSAITNLGDVIVHLFNDHVCNRKDWTMDRLIDWVRQMETPEPEAVEEKLECTLETVARS